jgi:protein tyrosine kinase modulator
MLEKRTFQEHRQDEDSGHFLTPSYFYEILKRRGLYFAIPFLLILAIGSIVTVALPANYLSRGTILVQSQEIPKNLVQPTVSALANDRIRVIEQRIMTRDNLLALARKFQITRGWRERLSGTEIVDFIRSRAQIKPSELKLQGQRRDAIAFSVGFEYEQPLIATKVANELVTMILNEDVRSRTEFATETTRFLSKEVKRLEEQLRKNDAEISAIKQSQSDSLTDTSQLDDGKELAALRAQLLLLSATYSSSHPDIKALKRKIKALQKTTAATNPNTDGQTSQAGTGSTGKKRLGLDALQTQRLGLKEELNKATQKLSTARLGESLERGQHSERLEVIEQPTIPQKPISPNRPKIFALVVAMALMAGGGLAFGAETLDQSIYSRTDLFSLVDSHLVVSIPYISTNAELRRNKIKLVTTIAVLAVIFMAGLIAILFLLPPPDVLFQKVMAKLFG